MDGREASPIPSPASGISGYELESITNQLCLRSREVAMRVYLPRCSTKLVIKNNGFLLPPSFCDFFLDVILIRLGYSYHSLLILGASDEQEPSTL